MGGRDESCYQRNTEVSCWEGRGRGRGWDESGPEGSAVSAIEWSVRSLGARADCSNSGGGCVHTHARRDRRTTGPT